MLYSLYAPMWDTNSTLINLLKEVLGYNDNEINKLKSEHYCRNIANNLTIEQAKNISEIFINNNFQIYLNDGTGLDGIIFWKDLGITLSKNSSKNCNCSKPITSREQLADLSIPKKIDEPLKDKIFPSKPTVTCPYCKSTNTKKISGTSRWMSTGLFGLASGKIGKQWRCNDCKSDF